MSEMIYVSRNYTEFGTFKPEEIADFKKRGIIIDSDYLRIENTDGWILAGDWTLEVPAAAPKKKAASKKKTSAKKAA